MAQALVFAHRRIRAERAEALAFGEQDRGRAVGDAGLVEPSANTLSSTSLRAKSLSMTAATSAAPCTLSPTPARAARSTLRISTRRTPSLEAA